MKYGKVYLDALGYELPPVVVSTSDLEGRLAPMYEKLHIAPGQLEAMTGITERRWWEEGYPLSQGAAAAARKALARANVRSDQLEVLIYAGVCREHFEPATACAVASEIGVAQDAHVFDLSNACLGVMNGIIDIANRIELGQIKAGMVVSCESSREITEIMIQQMLSTPTMETFSASLATLTGGSGAAAVLLTDGSFSKDKGKKLLGAATRSAPQHHDLCKWGMTLSPVALGKLMFTPDKLQQTVRSVMEPDTVQGRLRDFLSIASDRLPPGLAGMVPKEKLPAMVSQVMRTDSVGVLRHGVDLGVRTWGSLLKNIGWARDQVDKIICHQVGTSHRDTILRELGIPIEKDFSTFPYLGNIGTVSVPLTAALADQRQFLKPGDRVGFLGIGSGLNCLMLGWQW